MSVGYMYILECCDGSYYTGSTKHLKRRLREHQTMLGANYTKKRQPVKLVYFEEFDRIDKAFYREKQVQGWSRKKKQALIKQSKEKLTALSKKHFGFDTPSSTALSHRLCHHLSTPSSLSDRDSDCIEGKIVSKGTFSKDTQVP
jgi:predicted GIY-YIG superfamily endonuclease